MENGRYTYDIRMETPLGRRRGNLELMVEEHFYTGISPCSPGRCPSGTGISQRDTSPFAVICSIP